MTVLFEEKKYNLARFKTVIWKFLKKPKLVKK